MNICLVLISDGWGGAETVVYELARHLRDKGENVSIILNMEILKFYCDLEDVEIFNIGYVYNHKKLIKSIIFPSLKTKEEVYLSSFLWSLLNELFRPIYFKRMEKQVMRFLLDKNVDVINSHLENSDILVSCLNGLKIPWIATFHGPHLLKPMKKDSIRSVLTLEKRKARMLKDALNKVDKVIFVSNWLLNIFNNIISINNKSVVIHNGIRLLEFQRESMPTIRLKGDFDLLFPGGTKSQKNGDLVIKALYRVKDEIQNIHLYIALNVPQNHLIRKMVKDFGLEENVTFSGILPLQEYRTLLNSIDVLCMPSKEEAFGIVFLEAMAMGKPIIAADMGGVPEFIINGRNGILIEFSSAEVADAILYLYNNKDLRKEMSRNNVEDIKNFDWSPIVDKYIDVYRKTLIEKGIPSKSEGNLKKYKYTESSMTMLLLSFDK